MKQVKWGIIGCGNVTEVKSGPAFNKVPGSALVAVMRRNADKAADYARRHNVEKWYNDAQQLIEDTDINAIYVATPPSTHLAYAMAAIDAGKPVYVEKPMAMNLAEAKQMNDYAKQRGVKLSIAHYRRQLPMFLKIKSLLSERAIGDISLVQLHLLQIASAKLIANSEDNWRVNPALSGGGLFHDLAPHQIDMMLYLFGTAKEWKGFAANQRKTNASDDLVSGMITFDNNILFNGTWCFNVAEHDAKDSCTIFGSEGSINFGFFGNVLTVTKNGVNEKTEFEPVEHVQQPMIQEVVDYFLGNGENPCSGDVGAETIMLMDEFTVKN